MIIKENSNTTPLGKFERAGYEAERKVAYYLKMAFDDSTQLLVLNDLRLEFDDGINAQMDHLIIHQHGLIIIESKSVAGKLQVQDDGQWVRWYSQSSGKDRSVGMPNPIKQAKLQGQTLKRVLLKGTSDSTRKILEEFPIDVLVTFSTSNGGIFIASDKSLYPEVCPADAVDDYVKATIANRTNTVEAHNFSLSEVNRMKLANFLVKAHKPYQPPEAEDYETSTDQITAETALKTEQKAQEYVVADTQKATGTIGRIAETITNSSAVSEPKLKNACRKCQSENLEVRFGKNYYFKCLSCDENNRIGATCPNCKSLLKIRKDRYNFFAECIRCNSSELFHTNNS